jgi:class 3 adenylate cyclase
MTNSTQVNSLMNAFSSKNSRVKIVVMFVDIANSTETKQKEPEASWLTTFGYFFDIVNEIILRHDGEIIKYLGDGVMAIFKEEQAVEAINAAIQIQETLLKNYLDNIAKVRCSIGITFGIATQFQTNQGKDFVGQTIDLAARLCSAASPQAIIINSSIIDVINAYKIVSQRGIIERRSPQEYIKFVYKISLKGFTDYIECHEIYWSNQTFGVKPNYKTI